MPDQPTAAELKMRFAILRVVGERGLGRRRVDEITTGDVDAMARAAYRTTLSRSRPPDTQPAPGRPFVAKAPKVAEAVAACPPGGSGVPTGPVGLLGAPAAVQQPLTGLRRLRADPATRAVARLVADGVSNREIGERLGLTIGQAKGRVRAWLEALGFDGRAQLASWVAAGGLDRQDVQS